MSRRELPRLVSVIIPARDASDTLGAQLEALSRQTYQGDWEVLVIDNGSSDGTRQLTEGWAPKVPRLRVIEAPDLSQPAYARNVGARAAWGELLLHCDADDVAEPQWIAAMAEAAREGDVIRGALDYASLNQPRMPWHGTDARRSLPGAGELRFLRIGIGANFGIWKTVLEELGGWNEECRHGGDDADLCWRAQLHGFSVVDAERAVMRYRLRPSLKAYVRQRYRRARAAAYLFKTFRSSGMPRPSLRIAVLTWGSLLYRFPFAVFSPYWRLEWLQRAAVSAGRLVGSFEQRVLYL